MSAETLSSLPPPNRVDRQRAEALAEILGDFPSFCELLEIKNVNGKGLLKFGWDSWHSEQRRWERTRTGRDIVIKPRQVGFSTIELARDLWLAMTRPGYQVLVVTHDAELKKSLFLTVRMFAESLKRRGLLPKTRYSTTTEIVFAESGSAVRIVEAGKTESSAQDKGRSGTVHRLHATEMAFWGQAETTWGAILPAVPDDGEIVIESTANGAGGLYYNLVQEAREGRGQFKFHFFPWYEQKRFKAPVFADFDPTPLDKWETKLRAAGCTDQQISWWRFKYRSVDVGPEKTLRDYPVDPDSCFRVAGRQYFDPETIDDLMERVREPLETKPVMWQGRMLGELKVFEPYDARLEYVAGGDVSEGIGSDASTCTVVERRTGRVAATFWSDCIEPGDFGIAMAVIGTMYGMAKLAPERNNHGHAALRAMEHEALYPRGRIYSTDDDKLGWSTDVKTRPVMIDDLGAAIRAKLLSTPDRAMATECKTLIRNEKGKVEARDKGTSSGCKDDRWISWCIAWQIRSAPDRELQPANMPNGFF